MDDKFNFSYSTPEQQGIPSSAFLEFFEEIERERIEMHSMIVMRNRHIVAEGYWAPFNHTLPHRIFSAGKAVVGAAIMFAIQEKRLSWEDKVVDLLPESMPEKVSDRLQRLNIYHLMTMQTGHAKDTFRPMLEPGVDRAKVFFEQEIVYEPGTHFVYNNGVPDILALILYKRTNESVYEYLQPRLFEPLGIRGMTVSKNGHLDELPTMAFKTRDLFKLTVFYADGGKWEGKQLLDERMVREAGSYLVPSRLRPKPPYVAYDTQFGYGYQIWRNSVGGFRLDGGRGQYGIVLPEMGIIAAINANEQDPGIIPVLFWKHITSQLYARPIQENREVLARQKQLQEKLQSLTWLPASGEGSMGSDFSGSYYFKDQFCGCHRIDLRFQNEGRTLMLSTDRNGKEIQTELKIGEWTPCTVPFEVPELTEQTLLQLTTVAGMDPESAVGAYTWLNDHTIELHYRSGGWMGANIFRMTFHETGMSISHEKGVSYNLKHRSDLTPRGFRDRFIEDPVEYTSTSFERNL